MRLVKMLDEHRLRAANFLTKLANTDPKTGMASVLVMIFKFYAAGFAHFWGYCVIRGFVARASAWWWVITNRELNDREHEHVF